MATIDMLERLKMIQSAFSRSQSLEATVATERIARVADRTEQIIRQRAFLRDERRRLRLSSERLARQTEDLTAMQKPDWFPPDLGKCSADDRHVFLNVGGMIYECRESVLSRDEGSLLAGLLTPLSPCSPDHEGVFHFDRDWWLFRYILTFLRDGTLPDDRQLLAEVYREANFWKLRQLQRAIEEEKLNLIPSKGVESLDSMSATERQRWWRQNANSFAKKKEEVAAPPPPAQDWWMGTEYNGKKFGPLSSDPTKVVTECSAPDARPMLAATWSRA